LRCGIADIPGKSVKTASEYLAAAKGFTRWLWKDKRSAIDALVGLSKLANSETDIRHARRDLSPEELERLLDAARLSFRVKYHLSGTDRYFLYLTAAATGFRVSELASMTPESFNLDGRIPCATVLAACTKNREKAEQPLPIEVAATLRDYLRGKPKGQPVWPGKSWPVHASIMIRKDLHEARENWLKEARNDDERAEREASDFLVYQDREGRYADFHGLRHTFITMVGKSGVSPKEHQDLARHSSYALTGRYTHSRFHDLASAVQNLPIPTNTPEAPQQKIRATGTDHTSKNLGPNLGPQSDISIDGTRQIETKGASSQHQDRAGKQEKIALFQRYLAEVQKERDTGVEPVSQPWEGWAQPIYQSR